MYPALERRVEIDHVPLLHCIYLFPVTTITEDIISNSLSLLILSIDQPQICKQVNVV